jgi:hypothetical protein
LKQILCANEQCSSRDRVNSISIGSDLLLIGSSYKCPYCRGDKFIIVKVRKNGQKEKE